MALIWKDFSDSTTVHGLRFINKENSIKRRIFWGIIVLAGTAFFCVQMEKSVKGYFDYKVNTVVHMSNDGDATKFPAITICNANVLRKTKLEANKHDRRVQKLLQMSKKYLFYSNSADMQQNISDVRISGADLRELYASYGHTMDHLSKGGMLEFCRAPNYGSCDSKDFIKTLTYSGSCYTLNSGKESSRVIYAGASGRFSAVRIGLSVQVDEYALVAGNQQSSGITLLIHDQRDPPLADTHGMMIGPGVHASIGIKKRKITSKKYPFESKCRSEQVGSKMPYSRRACLRRCEEEFVAKSCKCKMAIDTIMKQGDIPLCDLNQTFTCAVKSATELFPSKAKNCDCPFACHSVDYTPNLSYAPYPTDIQGREMAIIELRKEKQNVTEGNIERKILSFRKNRLMLEIYYEQMDYLTMMHVPATTAVGIFAEIGGLLGISLGASFLTIIELLDFSFFYLIAKFPFKPNKEVSMENK